MTVQFQSKVFQNATKADDTIGSADADAAQAARDEALLSQDPAGKREVDAIDRDTRTALKNAGKLIQGDDALNTVKALATEKGQGLERQRLEAAARQYIVAHFGDAKKMDAFRADGVIAHFNNPNGPQGDLNKAAFLAHDTISFNAFPNIKNKVLDLSVDVEKRTVTVNYLMTATNTGPFFVPMLDEQGKPKTNPDGSPQLFQLPGTPTGKSGVIQASSTTRYDANYKIIEEWCTHDTAPMMAVLTPDPKAAR